jgi:hypothetical protein
MILQLTLGLIIYSTSKAGLFESEAFGELISMGYMSSEAEMANSIAFLGTIGSAVAITVAPFAIRYARQLPAPIYIYIIALFYVFCTAAWSNVLEETGYTFAKDIIYLAAMIVIVKSLSYSQIEMAALITCFAIGISSIYLPLTNEVYAFSLGADGWRGLFAHKNGLAGFCLFMIILTFPAALMGQHRTIAKACVVMLLALLVLSRGSTATITAISYMTFVIVVRWTVGKAHMDSPSRFLLVSIVAASAAIVASAFVTFFVLSGDLSFTGRARLWAYFLEQSSGHWIWGVGGHSLKLDSHIALQAIANVGNASPDSSLILIVFNWGLAGASLYILFLLVCMNYYYKEFSGFSVFGLGGLIAFVSYGAMESDAHFYVSLPIVCVGTQILLAQKFHKVRHQGGSQDQ